MKAKWLNAFVLTVLLLGMMPFSAQAAPLTEMPNAPVEATSADDDTPTIQVEPGLQQLSPDEETGYLIYFREKPDLSEAYDMDWEARGRYVAKQLQDVAKRSQADVRAHLDAQGVSYQAFWIANVIVVESSPARVMNQLTTFPEIEALRERRQPILFEPIELGQVPAPAAPNGVESNLTHIQVPDVWALGYSGEGLVVANIDTGVRYTHQALVDQYRGNQGGGSFDHDHNWYDPYSNSAEPYDTHDHGSHTIGTMIGDDGGTNQIGVAPDAQWISCMGFNPGATDAGLLNCGQFMIAPTDTDGNNPNPDLRPHIVNNSWGSCGNPTTYDPWFEGTIAAWHAAGIYPVFSNGNVRTDSPPCPQGLGQVGNPARYASVTGVGALGRDDATLASYSLWGPTGQEDTINPRGYPYLKPQVSAPGTNRSAGKNSNTDYRDMSGTSMASPHVAGLIALMWEAGPCLVGDYATTETILETTTTATSWPGYPGHPSDGPGGVPNQATGWGEINALAAVQAAAALCGDSTIEGQVTDRNTGAPIAGAEVLATSVTEQRQTTSDAEGFYVLNLFSDTYDLAATAFGYAPTVIPDVVATTGMTTTQNIQMDAAAWHTVSGAVTDATTGWPLYASLSFPGYPIDTVWNDPVDGSYSVQLPENITFTVEVNAWIPGYQAASRVVGPLTADATEDFALMADTAACIAPGYVMSGTCESPVGGGLVVGNVYDANNPADVLTGADVMNAAGETAVAVATPDDDTVDDAFYTLFAPAGTQTFTTTKTGYGEHMVDVTVAVSHTVAQDFFLPAGMLNSTPAGLNVAVELGYAETVNLDLENSGALDVDFELLEKFADPAVIPLTAVEQDSFGYAFADSDDPDGPEYEWIEIAPPEGGTGTAVGMSGMDDDHYWPLSLPFPFNFYGVDHDRIALASNGTVYFEDAYLGLGNTAIPGSNSYGVHTFIAHYWDDLVIDPGEVYYADLGDMFVIEYYQARRFSGSDPGTWQIVLYENGNILFQYQDAALDYGANATVGIQADTSTGLQYSYNTAALSDDLAICFAYPGESTNCSVGDDVPWLFESPMTGTVAATGNTSITADFDAAYVDQPGEYHAELIVRNDTPYGRFNIPVTMTVTGPASWGKLTGTVTGLGACDDDPAPLEGAEVQVESAATGQTWTVTTDVSGTYHLWLDQGQSPLTVTVSAPDYYGQEDGVVVTQGETTVLDFDLRLLQPCLSYDPADFDVTLPMGENTVERLALSNTSAGEAAFELIEIAGDFMPQAVMSLSPDVIPTRELLPGYDPEAVTTEDILSADGTPAMGTLAAGDVLAQWGTGLALPWGTGYSLAEGNVWLGNLGAGGGDDNNHEFATDGTPTGRTVAASFGGSWAGDIAFNPHTGTFWQVNVGGDNCIYEWDPTSGATGNSICNAAWTWTSQRGLAYDPTDDTFFIGGWNDTDVYHIDNTGAVIEHWTLNLGVSGLAYNFEAGYLFIIENSTTDTITVFDAASGSIVDTFTVSGFGNYAAAGLAIDCDGNLWAANMNDASAYLIDSGVPANLCIGEVDGIPWLSEDPITGTIAIESDAVVDLTFDAGVPETMQPGTYYGELNVNSNAANVVPNVPLTLTVTPPDDWGKLTGEVTGLGHCDTVTPTLLENAEVTVESGASALVWELTTDVGGTYHLWLDAAHNPLTVTVEYPDHVTQVFTDVTVTAGETTVLDAGLRWEQPCLTVDPDLFDVTVELGLSTTVPFSLTNWGAAGASFNLAEENGGFIVSSLVQPTAIPLADGATDGERRFELALGDTSERGLLADAWQPNGAVELILDDDSAEDAIGVSSGDQFLWLNRFTPDPSDYPFTLDQVWMLFRDSASVGESIEVVFWEDTDGDGDPGTGATFLHSEYVTVQANDGTTWSVYDLNTPVFFSGPGDVLIGAVNRDAVGSHPAAIDATASQGRSWVGVYAGAPPAPPTLPADDLWGTIDSFGFAGNWMIRGSGVTGFVGTDVPWLSEDPITGTVDADSTFVVDLTFDATDAVTQVTQPGEYFGTLFVNSDDPINDNISVPVTMTVEPPATWGKLMGTVHSLGYCDADPAPVADQEVLIEGSSGVSWTVTTDVSGTYQLWLDEMYSPLTVTVSYPNHEDGEATGVAVSGGTTTTQDFDLRWLVPCVEADPLALHATLELGTTATEALTLTNTGAVITNWDLAEVDPVNWLDETPASGSLAADSGEQVVDVDFDASVTGIDQPGDYLANLRVNSDDPYAPAILPVTMTVTPPATWGELLGVVSSLGHCDAEMNPLEGAEVVIWDSAAPVVTLTTDISGTYSYWLPADTYTVTFSAPDHATEVITDVPVTASATTTQDASLTRLGPCVSDIAPSSMEVTLAMGMSETLPLTMTNVGAGELDFEFVEMNGGFTPMLMISAQQAIQASTVVWNAEKLAGECAVYQDSILAEPAEARECYDFVPAPQTFTMQPLAPTDSGYAQDIGYLSDNFVTFALNDFPGQTVMGTSTNAYYGMDFDPEATTLYALNDATAELGTIDLTTGAFTALVPCPAPSGNWTGLTIDPVGGTFYASDATNLYTIDPATGANTLVGPFGTSLMIDIAMNTAGEMYGHDIGTDSIYKIDSATGAATLVGPTGYDANYAQGMDFDNDDGTLYIFLYQGSGANVYGVADLTTGAVTPLAVSDPQGEFESAVQTTGITQIPWLFEDPESGTVPLTATGVADITFDAGVPEVAQPGDYFGELQINNNDPVWNGFTVPVAMHVTLPDTYGQVTGTVTGLGPCDDPLTAVPLEGADVLVASATQTWTLSTDADGVYALWLDEAHSPVTITVDAMDHVSDVVTGVTVVSGTTTVQDVVLRPEAPCATLAPMAIDEVLTLGMSTTVPITIGNTGAYTLAWTLSDDGVAWLDQDPTTGETAPDGGTSVVTVTLDATGFDQPGTYTATLFVDNDSINDPFTVPVTLTVEAPATWGKLEGLVQGLGYCDAMTMPLEGAHVWIQSWMTKTVAAGLEEDFEGDDGGFVGSLNWERGTYNWVGGNCDDVAYPPPAAHSGTDMWGAVLNDCYNNLGDTSVLNFELDLSDALTATLSWWDWYDVYENYDHGEVYVNGAQVYDRGTGYVIPTAWEQHQVDLTPHVGDIATIEFRMYSTTVVNRAGWYIDDVRVETNVMDLTVQPLDWLLTTDVSGTYGIWLDELYSPLTVTVSHEAGYGEQVFTGVDIVSGTATTLDADLHWLQPCLTPTPDALDLNVPMGTTTTTEINLANMGAVTGTFLLHERSLGYDQLGPLAAGGPDGFGYQFADSNEAGISPVYDFVDISGIGTPLVLDDNDSAEVDIGFDFKFYGADALTPDYYDSVFVGSNGFLSFGAGFGDLSPDNTLPDPTLPNNLIAAAWDDLEPGTVYYQSFAQCPYSPDPNTVGACFIVQYDDFTHTDGDLAGTWEVILFRSGSILMQYADVDAPDAATGIENQLGNVGLNYGPTLADDLAICFGYPGEGLDCQSTQVPWLDVNVDEGDVAAYDDLTMTVTLDASVTEIAAPGDYLAEIIVDSNDPFNPFRSIPVTMTVDMPATMARLSGDVYGWGYCDAVSDTLPGAQVLIQTELGDNHVLTSDTEGAYAVWVEAGQITMTVEHEGYISVTITDSVDPGFAPQEDTHLYLDGPCASVTTDEAFDVVVTQGEQVTRSLTLHNGGAGLLTYDNVLATGLWLSVDPETGSVAPYGAQSVNVVFDATGLDVGVYQSNMEIVHNDLQASRMFVRPIQMTVVAEGTTLGPTMDAKEGNPGEMVTYVMTLTNFADTAVTFDVQASDNDWTTTVPAEVAVAANDTSTFTVDVEIPRDAHSGYSDTVTIDVESQGADEQKASALLQTTVAEQPVVLVVAKTADPGDVVDPGDPITYTITVSNDGHDPVAVALSDQVPTHTTYVQGSVTGGLAYTEMPAQVAWNGTIDPGAERTFTFQVAVAADAPPGGWITNTVVALVDGEEYIEQVEVRIRPLIYLPIVLNGAD